MQGKGKTMLASSVKQIKMFGKQRTKFIGKDLYFQASQGTSSNKVLEFVTALCSHCYFYPSVFFPISLH